MIAHHPNDELLLACAAGNLATGAAIVVAAHLEVCQRCRAIAGLFESVGGAMLESLEPVLMAPQALARTLTRIDDQQPPTRRHAPPAITRPSLPPGLTWPRSLQQCAVSRWHWLGPGVRWSRVKVPHDDEINVFLLRIGPGKSLPRHTHSGIELTQVLCGSFDDGLALFAAGDFDASDESIHHQPILQAGGECICLASLNGHLVFDGAIARVIGSLVGI